MHWSAASNSCLQSRVGDWTALASTRTAAFRHAAFLHDRADVLRAGRCDVAWLLHPEQQLILIVTIKELIGGISEMVVRIMDIHLRVEEINYDIRFYNQIIGSRFLRLNGGDLYLGCSSYYNLSILISKENI